MQADRHPRRAAGVDDELELDSGCIGAKSDRALQPFDGIVLGVVEREYQPIGGLLAPTVHSSSAPRTVLGRRLLRRQHGRPLRCGARGCRACAEGHRDEVAAEHTEVAWTRVEAGFIGARFVEPWRARERPHFAVPMP